VDAAELWRWIWLALAVAGVVGEMATAGLFFLLPFGIGAAVAAVLAFAGVGLVAQWVAFVAVSALAVAFTRPLARRLDRNHPSAGAGARRLIGRTGTVVSELTGGAGVVRVEGEEWRAVTNHGVTIPAGSKVLVTEVTGTRLEVLPLELAEGDG
jgi:inner membrane protein